MIPKQKIWSVKKQKFYNYYTTIVLSELFQIRNSSYILTENNDFNRHKRFLMTFGKLPFSIGLYGTHTVWLTPQECFRFMSNFPDLCMYEYLNKDMRFISPYFDIDAKKSSAWTADEIHKHVEQVISVLKSIFPIKSDTYFKICGCTRKDDIEENYRLSLHICIKHILTTRSFLKSALARNKDTAKALGIDPLVYSSRQKMRIIGSKKDGENSSSKLLQYAGNGIFIPLQCKEQLEDYLIMQSFYKKSAPPFLIVA